MHEWSYAALKQLQNPKPFVITVARIPPISFVYIGCIGRPQIHTMSLSSDVAASGVDLRIDCTQVVLVVAQQPYATYMYIMK